MQLSDRTYTVEVVDRVHLIDPGEWDALAGGRPFVNHRWLRLAETVLLDHEPYYLQLRRRGQLEAAALCTVSRRHDLSAYVANQFLEALASRVLRRFPPLICEIPLSFQPGLLMRPGCDPDLLLPVVLEALDHLAAQQHASFLVLRHLNAGAAASPGLRAAGCYSTILSPSTYLELSCPTFAAYQASLPHRRRSVLSRYRRRAYQAGVSLETVRPSAENEPLLRRLVHNVFDRHGTQDPYVPDLFSRAAAVLGDDLTLVVSHQEQRLSGCAALLRSGPELLLKWVGLDYDRTMKTYTYHVLMIETVRIAIDMGVRILRLGPTSYQIKKQLGATLHDRYMAVALQHSLLNRFLGRGLGLVFRS